jgi:hypothetical protein
MRKKRQIEKQQKKEETKKQEVKQRQEAKALRQRTVDIIETLEETNARAILQIERIVERLGIEFAEAKLKEADEVESQGGLMIPQENRRRTRGGVFFFLVKKELKAQGRKQDMKEIFYKNQGEKKTDQLEASPETTSDNASHQQTAA